MNARVRRWLSPVPTTPANPYWPTKRERPVDEQVASGLRIVAWIVGGFAVLLLLLLSLRNLHRHPTIFNLFGVALTVFAIFDTVQKWAWLTPVLLFINGLRGPASLLYIVLTGRDPRGAHELIPRSEALLIIACFVSLAALNWRFIGKHPAMTTLVDRLMLTTALVAGLNQLAVSPRVSPASLAVCGLALVAGFAAYKLNPPPRHAHGPAPAIAEEL